LEEVRIVGVDVKDVVGALSPLLLPSYRKRTPWEEISCLKNEYMNISGTKDKNKQFNKPEELHLRR